MCLGFLLGAGHCLQPVRCPAHLLPSWKRANSRAARSNTVSDVTVTGPLALLGNMPCTRTSCQSEWSLQISTESKYLRGSWAQPRRGPLRGHCSAPTPQHAPARPSYRQVTPMPLGMPSPACPILTPPCPIFCPLPGFPPQSLCLLGTTVLNEIAVLHPEDALAAAVGHQVMTQGSRPVRPLIGPAAVPGEAAPGVSEPQ